MTFRQGDLWKCSFITCVKKKTKKKKSVLKASRHWAEDVSFQLRIGVNEGKKKWLMPTKTKENCFDRKMKVRFQNPIFLSTSRLANFSEKLVYYLLAAVVAGTLLSFFPILQKMISRSNLFRRRKKWITVSLSPLCALISCKIIPKVHYYPNT